MYRYLHGTGQGSPDEIRNMVMKARLKRPNSTGAMSLKSETPRMESANIIYMYIYI